MCSPILALFVQANYSTNTAIYDRTIIIIIFIIIIIIVAYRFTGGEGSIIFIILLFLNVYLRLHACMHACVCVYFCVDFVEVNGKRGKSQKNSRCTVIFLKS